MPPPLQDVRALIVEDDPIIGLDLTQTLEEAGAVVVGSAYDVPGALALLEASEIDVAVLDNLIIGGDSLRIADKLAQRGIAFLFHTSHKGELGTRYPTVQILDKPSRPGELVRAVQASLGKRG